MKSSSVYFAACPFSLLISFSAAFISETCYFPDIAAGKLALALTEKSLTANKIDTTQEVLNRDFINIYYSKK